MYVDDIIVYFNDLEDHLEHVDQVFKIVCDAILAFYLVKYHFFRASVLYLDLVTVPG